MKQQTVVPDLETPFYTPAEERFNYITHGIGVVLSIIGLVILVVYNLQSEWYVIASVVVFGLSMLSVYTSSTLYHWVVTPRLKKKMRLIDHLAIYLLIAGSYTPFALVNLRDHWGIWVFFIVWTLAILGMLMKFSFRNKMDKLGNLDAYIYVGIGCIAFFFMKPMVTYLPANCIWLLLLGGAMYLIGVVFYLQKNMSYNHGIWHLFVMAGSAFHYLSILLYVQPLG